MNDKQIIRSISRGEINNFPLLIEKYQQPLQSLLCSCCLDLNSVKIHLHESFVQAYLKLDQFDPQRPFFPWLKKIALNRLRDEIRSQNAHSQRLQHYLLQKLELAQDNQSERKMNAMQHCLSEIDESLQQVLHLRYWKQLSIDEISEHLDRKNGALTMQLTRIRESLKTCIRQKLWNHHA